MMILLLGVLGALAATAAIVLTVRTTELTDSQKRLADATAAPTRELALAGASVGSVAKPSAVMDRAVSLGRKVSKPASLEGLSTRIDKAGLLSWDAERIMGAKVLAAGGGLLIGLLLGALMGTLPLLFLLPVCAAVGWFIPDLVIYQARYSRKIAMQRAAADTIDLLGLTISAGVSMDSALRTVAENTTGPLSQEIAKATHAMAVGVSRDDALKAMAQRVDDPDVTRFVNAIMQSGRRGSSVGDVLAIQSTELRRKQRQSAEEQAAKIPVKILFPMMVFILPTLFLIMMAPAVVNIMFTLGR